jgi:hypothetical protein
LGELSKVREDFRNELVEHREELRVLKTQVIIAIIPSHYNT